MFLATSLAYYKREDIRNALLAHSPDKEIAVRFGERFGKRPDTLKYSNDILELAKNKATSFHASEERWGNPLLLKTEMSRRDLDELRTGWDLVLDIDCPVFEYSKISAYYIIRALRHQGIRGSSCKFSGNKGFHIGVPFEAFPEQVGGRETRLLFPEAPKKIAEYIKFLIHDLLESAILKFEKEDVQAIADKVGKEKKDIISEQGIDIDSFIEIDTILISSRHMYRMPYSLHEKSGLVSLPIDANDILQFNRSTALPEQVKVDGSFLDRNVQKGEAGRLLVQALDFHPPRLAEDGEDDKKRFEEFDVGEAIPDSFFPPCIQNIQKGVKDGRKRSIFILRNFLSCCAWDKDKTSEFILDWNKNNPLPLKEVVIKGQLRFSGKKVPPPNCDNNAYYKDFGVCTPDNFCRRIKNPCQYSKLKVLLNKRNKKGRKKKSSSKPKDSSQAK